MGHVLLDIFGNDPGNSGNPDRAVGVSHLDRRAMEQILDRIEPESGIVYKEIKKRVGGGQALLTIAAKALGVDAQLAGCVGEDKEGVFLRSRLKEYGIDLDISTGRGRTGVFLCLRARDGGKRIFVYPGAARDIRGRELKDEFLKPGWILSLDGLLMDSAAWLSETAQKAVKAGMKVAIDLSTPINARERGGELRDFAARYCDFVFANEEEFEEVQKTTGRIIAPRETWIVKLGPKGARSFHRGGAWSAGTRWTAPDFDTGAGDFFAAGYLVGNLSNLGEEASLSLGNAAGLSLIESGTGALPLAELSKLGRMKASI
ncbi:MAG: carbohydrate kinase family protein [Spirochaetes bacterium]|nr:carbohydrate kinase family protein [Spirochaetota bacterium]